MLDAHQRPSGGGAYEGTGSLLPPKVGVSLNSPWIVGKLFEDTGVALIRAVLSTLNSQHVREFVFSKPLVDEIGTFAARVVTVEINLCRLGGRFEVADEVLQYRHFMAALGDSSSDLFSYLSQKYPVLAGIVFGRVRGVLESLERMLRAFEEQPPFDLLSVGFDAFSHGTPTVGAVQPLGDPHNGGMRSLLVSLSSGQRVMFKPRQAQNDRFYGEIANRLSKRLGSDAFRVPKVIDATGGHWSEYVDGDSRPSPDSVEFSAYGLGVWLGLGYVAALEDLHFENVVFARGQVSVVDFECGPLFRKWENLEDPLSIGTEPLLRVGILPSVVDSEGSELAFNFGVVGDASEQAPPYALHVPDRDGRSDVSLVLEDVGARSTEEQTKESPDWSNPIVRRAVSRGLSEAVAELATMADEISAVLSEYRPRARHVLRPTQLYSEAVRKISHPHFASNVELARLGLRGFLGGGHGGDLLPVLDAEVESLLSGDIPLFRETDTGRLELPGFWQGAIPMREFSLDLRLERAASPGFDLRADRLVTQAFLLLPQPLGNGEPRASGFGSTLSGLDYVGRSNTGFSMLDAAISGLGQSILSNADISSAGYSWTNLQQHPGGKRVLDAANYDVYGGSAGTLIALMTASSYDKGLRRETLDLAVESARAWGREVSRLDRPGKIGAFNGTSGLAYVGAVAACTFAECSAEFEPLIDVCVERLIEDLSSSNEWDLLSGSAGVLRVASQLAAERLGHERAVAELEHLALAHLLDSSEEIRGVGRTWPSADGVWLGGLSHGVAGAALALASCSLDSGRVAAEAWSAQLATKQAKWWADRRASLPQESLLLHAWCHGSDGVLLAHSLFPERLVLPESEGDQASLFTSWLEEPFPDTHMLCHGASGRLTVLAAMNRAGALEPRKSSSALASLRSDLAAWALSSITSSTVEALSDGLMTGRAGVLFSLAWASVPRALSNPLDLSIRRVHR